MVQSCDERRTRGRRNERFFAQEKEQRDVDESIVVEGIGCSNVTLRGELVEGRWTKRRSNPRLEISVVEFGTVCIRSKQVWVASASIDGLSPISANDFDE